MAGHGHQHPTHRLTDPRSAVLWFVIAMGAVTLLGLVVFWPGGRGDLLVGTPLDTPRMNATVTGVKAIPCDASTEVEVLDCETIDIRVTSGERSGDTSTILQSFEQRGYQIQQGDDIVVSYTPGADEGFEYTFVDYQRRAPLLLLAGIFVMVVLLLGRFQGLRALAGAGVSVLVLVVFLLPALLAGESPLVIALIAASVIAFGALYITHGVNDESTVALVGTQVSLLLVAALSVIFVSLSELTGLVATEAPMLQISTNRVDLSGLLLAGIVVGTLGVLDDVTVTQVSAVSELKAADPTATGRELYRRALRIGRDHIASTVNTLVLAYAGASLPLLLLFTQSTQPLGRVLTSELVAIELVRTLVGSIGLVASVPITTALAVWLLTRDVDRAGEVRTTE